MSQFPAMLGDKCDSQCGEGGTLQVSSFNVTVVSFSRSIGLKPLRQRPNGQLWESLLFSQPRQPRTRFILRGAFFAGCILLGNDPRTGDFVGRQIRRSHLAQRGLTGTFTDLHPPAMAAR